MKVVIALGMLALPLAGCVTDQEIAWMNANFYSRADVDAINAEIACRQLARNLLQVERCGFIRR